MREHLFKAKRIDNSEWVYGFIILDTDGATPYIVECAYWNCEESKDETLYYEVDLDTVCEYTGLQDKNGKKVFEGDMVSTDIKRPYNIVVYRDGSFMFNCNDGGEGYYDIMLPILKEPQTQYKYGEVIGNVFDNPELLEVE